MTWGIKERAREGTASVEGLKGQTVQRLEGSLYRLGEKGLSRAFAQSSAQGDPLGDMGLLGGLFSHMVLFGGFFHGLEAMIETQVGPMPLFDAFNHSMTASLCEAVFAIQDEKARYNRSRRLSGLYPEGRRQETLFDAPVSRKFNLVSANDDWRFNRDVQAEIACMFEMLDMLAVLEKDGIHHIKIAEDKPVYEILKDVSREAGRTTGFRTMASPVRRELCA